MLATYQLGPAPLGFAVYQDVKSSWRALLWKDVPWFFGAEVQRRLTKHGAAWFFNWFHSGISCMVWLRLFTRNVSTCSDCHGRLLPGCNKTWPSCMRDELSKHLKKAKLLIWGAPVFLLEINGLTVQRFSPSLNEAKYINRFTRTCTNLTAPVQGHS